MTAWGTAKLFNVSTRVFANTLAMAGLWSSALTVRLLSVCKVLNETLVSTAVVGALVSGAVGWRVGIALGIAVGLATGLKVGWMVGLTEGLLVVGSGVGSPGP